MWRTRHDFFFFFFPPFMQRSSDTAHLSLPGHTICSYSLTQRQRNMKGENGRVDSTARCWSNYLFYFFVSLIVPCFLILFSTFFFALYINKILRNFGNCNFPHRNTSCSSMLFSKDTTFFFFLV